MSLCPEKKNKQPFRLFRVSCKCRCDMLHGNSSCLLKQVSRGGGGSNNMHPFSWWGTNGSNDLDIRNEALFLRGV